LEEMIQQPGCPNLYWALTDLPNPLISLRRGVQGDRMLLEAEFAGFDQQEPMGEESLEKFKKKLITSMKDLDFKGNPQNWLEEQEKNEDYIRTARKRLVDSGLNEDRVKEFPALQVVFLDQKLDYEGRRDELMKWMSLHYWELEADMLNSPVL